MRVKRSRKPVRADWLKGPMLACRIPVELGLTGAVRRLSRQRPDVFERLGEHEGACFLIVPTNWPVAFALSPRRSRGMVKVVCADAGGPFAARIEGSLLDLLGLFDGALDADAAFFARSIHVEGDTGAVVALHNALEAAELSLADLLGMPIARRALDGGVRLARNFASQQAA